jgi:hypothetical protein
LGLVRYLLVAIALIGAVVGVQCRPISEIGSAGNIPLVCGSDVIAFGGDIRVELTSGHDVPDGCDIFLINADMYAGKRLIGFPKDINRKLYPGQSVGFTSYKGQWISKYKPGRYDIPGPIKVLVDNRGDDDNDGISLPLKHLSAAVQEIQRDFDVKQMLATIAPTVGEVFENDTIGIGGQPVGANLIALSPNGNGTITLVHKGTCVISADNGELYLWADQFGEHGEIDFYCNTDNNPSTPQLLAHNNGMFDGSGRLVFHGAGKNDVALSFDGPTAGSSIMDGIRVAGIFDTVWKMEQGGGRFTLGCRKKDCTSIMPTADESREKPSIGRLFMVIGSEHLRLGACPQKDGYESIGPSVVGGNGLLVKYGCFIPGTPDGVPLMSQNGKVYDSAY